MIRYIVLCDHLEIRVCAIIAQHKSRLSILFYSCGKGSLSLIEKYIDTLISGTVSKQLKKFTSVVAKYDSQLVRMEFANVKGGHL